MVAIGDVLPRTKLYAELYPSDMMMEALYRLYAHMLPPPMKAARWYTSSRCRQAVHAWLSPYEITYKDSVEQIAKCTHHLDAIVGTASRVEQRYIATSQDLQSRQLEDVSLTLIDIYSEIQTMQTSMKARDTQLDQVLKTALGMVISC